MDNQQNASTNDLQKRIGETARSRFVAAKRLEARDQRIGWLVALGASYTIILTVAPYFMRLPVDKTDLLNFATVCLSIVTLVSSLIIASRHDAVNAEQHHRCALELNELKRAISSNADCVQKSEDIGSYNSQYAQILQKFSINHDQIDYYGVMLDRPQDYPWLTWGKKMEIRFALLWANGAPILLMVLLTVAIFWLVLIYALPSRLSRV